MKKLTLDEKATIERLYKEANSSFKSIGKLIGRDYRTIKTYLEILNLKTKSQSELQRKYPIQENFFDMVDTEEKAYILGFIYADGCNSTEKNNIIINLQEKDKEILIKITDLIQPTKPLQYIDLSNKINNNGFGKSQNQYRLVIANKHISQRLVELGCGKAKTHNLVFPKEEQVPSYLIRHFIRGYFDGDGSISGTKQKQISFTGRKPFLLAIQNILIKELGFSKTKLLKRWKESTNDITSLVYCGKNQCIKFRDWLYKDSKIYLKRKKIKFEDII